MRAYRMRLEEYGISPQRFAELLAFCRQYPGKKAEAAALLGIQGGGGVTTVKDARGNEVGIVMPRGLRISTPTADRAIRRVLILEDCDLIDDVLRAVSGGEWEAALRLHVCYGMAVECIDQTIRPSANRNAFFRAKREFFVRLHYRLMERRVGAKNTPPPEIC